MVAVIVITDVAVTVGGSNVAVGSGVGDVNSAILVAVAAAAAVPVAATENGSSVGVASGDTTGNVGAAKGDPGWPTPPAATGAVTPVIRKLRVCVGVGNNETTTGVGEPVGVDVSGIGVKVGVKVGGIVGPGTGVTVGEGVKVGVGVNWLMFTTALAPASVCWPSALEETKVSVLLMFVLVVNGPSTAAARSVLVSTLLVIVKTAPGASV